MRRHKSSERYLLDTNVVSETFKPSPNAKVRDFLENTGAEKAYLSVVTLGELLRGIYRLESRNPEKALELKLWHKNIEASFRGRVLVLDRDIADRWAWICSIQDKPRWDALIAATAAVHDLTVVTRNTKDFEDLSVPVFNPWES